jgi:hypothetical protein
MDRTDKTSDAPQKPTVRAVSSQLRFLKGALLTLKPPALRQKSVTRPDVLYWAFLVFDLGAREQKWPASYFLADL